MHRTFSFYAFQEFLKAFYFLFDHVSTRSLNKDSDFDKSLNQTEWIKMLRDNTK